MPISTHLVFRRTVLGGLAALAIPGVARAQSLPNLGTMRVVSKDGRNILMLEESPSGLRSERPVLMLHKSPMPGANDISGMVEIGALKNKSGRESFPLPNTVEPRDFGSAVVYDKTQKVLLGYLMITMVN